MTIGQLDSFLARDLGGDFAVPLLAVDHESFGVDLDRGSGQFGDDHGGSSYRFNS